MIPRELQQIAWSDLQRLVDIGREEDDTIEFKRSFKTGDDYLSFNDRQREQSLDALAREVLAFLNTRGGDLVIGVSENGAGKPVASELSPIQNASEAADRVARGLAALIEPVQTNIAVRAITDPDDPSKGALVIRAHPSLRAPHRSKRTLECYVRRGSESVPMPMDEIQDLTVNRTRLRLEQKELHDRQFSDFTEGRSDHQLLKGIYFHVRAVSQPLVEQEITIDDQLLTAMGNGRVPYYSPSGRQDYNDVAFRQLRHEWEPILRGQKREYYYEHATTGYTDFMYACKRIKESGILSFDFASSSHFEDRTLATVHFEWLVGFFAQVYQNVLSVSALRPTLLPATLRVGIHVSGQMSFAYGSGMWAESRQMPAGLQFIPDFTVEGEQSFSRFFDQIQVDVFSLVGARLDHRFSLQSPDPKS